MTMANQGLNEINIPIKKFIPKGLGLVDSNCGSHRNYLQILKNGKSYFS